jgi:hypothetical protein
LTAALLVSVEKPEELVAVPSEESVVELELELSSLPLSEVHGFVSRELG